MWPLSVFAPLVFRELTASAPDVLPDTELMTPAKVVPPVVDARLNVPAWA